MHLLQSTANLLAALLQRRRTEEQLAHSQRLEAVGQLTGGIAHDFNNLLTVMSGSLQLLEMECGQQPEVAELIASALRSVGRGAELTAKLLAFARRQRLSPSAVLPARLLRDLELMLRRTLGDASRLKVDCPEGIPAAFADASQLDAALLNLALNARDAMPRGGDITIAVEERWIGAEHAAADLKPGHYIVFSVTDTGHGMTPETLARAVEPFYTTKGTGRGSGLGLSMVYGFVEQSGGHFRIDSQLGYGTRVELYLPVARSTSVEATQVASAPAAGQGQLVLVVEDEPEVRNIAAAFVRSLGYRVHAVVNAEEALQYIDDDPAIALLFSDVMLGAGMNGKELALAARRRRPQLPVLLTSGYEEPVPVRGAEAFELLLKPYRREQLAAAIQRSLAGGCQS
jgi:nitrogen-specific signal transduction histidine kinase/ActR/RegA family two-component response regulator